MSNYDIEPASHAFAITPSDTVALSINTRAIYVGTNGNLKVTTINDEDVTFVGLSGLIPVRAKLVFSTGTTADNIVGLY